jgi:hypothetical protein
MTDGRKNRGRPKGTEIDDSKMLTAIADMLIASPSMKATTAMRRIAPNWTEKEIHRWQSKWKQRKEVLMVEAAARAEEKQRMAVKREATSAPRMSSVDILKYASRVSDPMFRLAEGIRNDPIWQFAEKMRNDPIMQFAEKMRNDPIVRFAEAMQNDPVVRLMKELNSPASRIARGLNPY